jgi:hypothetical protein
MVAFTDGACCSIICRRRGSTAYLCVVESAGLLVRRCTALTFVAVFVSGCDAASDPTSGPHPPANGDERAAAAEYRDFMRALERKDASVICRQLEPPLARSYGCAPGRPLRVPRALRRIDVPLRELFASLDPTVPSVIQISSQSTRQDGYSLILFYRRDANDKWRVHKVMIGGYG